MTGNQIGAWSPEHELTTLLDRLTDELAGAYDHEIAACLRDAGEDLEDAAQPIRRIVAAADAHGTVPPASHFIAQGLRAYLARNH